MSIARYQKGIARNASESAHPSLWRGLKFFWSPSADNGGNRILERANKKANLLPIGAPKRISREKRKPIYLDGAADALSVDIDLAPLGRRHSIVLWAFIRSISTNILFEHTPNLNSTNGFICYVDGGSIYAGSHSTVNGFNYGHSSAPSTGRWVHIAVVLDRDVSGTGGNLIFIDGNQSTVTQDFTATLSDNLDNSTLYFGARGGSSLFAAVELDDIAIWSRALSAAEIKQLANGASPLERIDEVPQYTVVIAPAGGQPIWKRLGGVAFARQTGNITTW